MQKSNYRKLSLDMATLGVHNLKTRLCPNVVSSWKDDCCFMSYIMEKPYIVVRFWQEVKYSAVPGPRSVLGVPSLGPRSHSHFSEMSMQTSRQESCCSKQLSDTKLVSCRLHDGKLLSFKLRDKKSLSWNCIRGSSCFPNCMIGSWYWGQKHIPIV